MHAMTGSWLLVKWAGITVAAIYIALFLVVLVRFRRDLSRLRGGLIMPAIIAVFVSSSVPSVFESVAIARICFVISCLVYVCGIGILTRGLIQKNHESLLKADG